METSSKKRIIILSATGILLTGLICLFISRNIILCHIVDKRTTRIEQAYGLQIHYQKLQMYNPQIEMFARFKMKSSFHKTKRII